MIVPFRKTSLHIHPLFPSLLLFCLFTGRFTVLISVLALLWHEAGHLLLLILFGKMPRQISLTPFGGMMEMPKENVPSVQLFFIALAGPLFSALGCLFCLLGYRDAFLPESFCLPFFRANLLLMLFNLLPALPLDGGRMLQALLSAFLPRHAVEKALLSVANMAALFLIFLSLKSAWQGQYQFAPAYAGAYLMYAAGMEGRKSPLRYYSSLVGRRSGKQLSYPVQQLAVPEDTPLYSLPGRMKENCYHLLHVIGPDGMQLLGTLTDQDICTHLMENASLTASQALQRAKKQRSP